MDPPLDPPQPPLLPQPTVALPFTAIPVANPTPPLPVVHNHPPYAEMIAAAISALNERDGSSKQAIAKYIQTQYTGQLPPTHSALLSHHIKRLKNSGQLVMVKNSYKLPVPGSVHVPASNGAFNAVPSDLASSGPAKRRGRPPKAKPELLQAAVAVPVFQQQPMDVNAAPVIVPMAEPPAQAVAVGPVNGTAPAGTGTGRGPGSLSNQGGVKRGRGRPPKSGGPPLVSCGVPLPVSGDEPPPVSGVSARKGRGRPKKTAAVGAAPAGPAKRAGRPRSRPRKLGYVNEGVAPAAAVGGQVKAVAPPSGGAVVVGGKRRGRPPKAISEAKKPRKLSGKPLGRPKKTELAAPAQTADSQLLVAYLDLKAKYDNLQSRTKQAASIIKPYLNNETAFNALQELELLADVNINAPSNVPAQQQAPAQPVQPPQPVQLPQPVIIPQFQS